LFIIPTILCVSLVSGSVRADEPDATTSQQMRECRYGPTGKEQVSKGPMVRVILPPNDLFRPLMADMKQPRFYASYRRVRFLGSALPAEEQGNVINAGVVGFGGTFGLWAIRRYGGCDGIQVNVHAGTFSQFNLSKSSVDLINSDFIVGIPVTCRPGRSPLG